MDGTGCAAPLLGFHTAAFDEDQNKMWIFGGINESSPQNGLYRLACPCEERILER